MEMKSYSEILKKYELIDAPWNNNSSNIDYNETLLYFHLWIQKKVFFFLIKKTYVVSVSLRKMWFSSLWNGSDEGGSSQGLQ